MAITRTTTVVAAAASQNLITLDAGKAELGIQGATQDAWLTSAIAEISAVMAAYVEPVVFPEEDLRDVFYSSSTGYCSGESGFVPGYLSGSFSQPPQPSSLQLGRWPVTELTSIVGSDGILLVQDTDFILDARKGTLRRISGGVVTTWFSFPITVLYSAGYETIPADVQMAAKRLLTQRYYAKGRDPTQRATNDPDEGSQEFWIGTLPGQDGALPPEVSGILDRYRVLCEF